MVAVAPGKGSANSKGRVGRLLATTRRYGSLIVQLGKDVFRRFRPETIKILLAAAASLACQVAALGVLYIYLRALENNELLLGYLPRESFLLFVGIALVTLFLFVSFSLLEYRASISILSLCRQYQNLGTGETLSVSSKLPHWFANDSEEHISIRHLKQIVSIDINHRSRMARTLMLAIIPSARVVASGGALLYINPQFSLLIVLAMGIPVIGLYSVGKQVADTVTSRETEAGSVFNEQKELLEKSWEKASHILPGDLDWEQTLGTANSRHRQYFRRLRARAYGTFLINVANTVAIMVLVMSLGYWILSEEQGNWSLWLTYLVALRYFLTSLNSVAKSVVAATRFMRQTQRFSAFMAAATLAVHCADPSSAMPPAHIVEAYSGDNSPAVSDDELDED